MPFDLSTAKPVGGFDLSTAQPVVGDDEDQVSRAARRAKTAAEPKDKGLLYDLYVSPLEAAGSMASGMVGKVVGDVAGLGSIPLHAMGAIDTDPIKVREAIQHAFEMRPSTRTGQAMAEYNPLALMGKALDTVGSGAEWAVNQIPVSGPNIDIWKGALASGAHEAVNQSPILAIRKVPTMANAGADVLQDSARRWMQSAAKPGIKVRQKGLEKMDANLDTLLEEGINPTVGGYNKLQGKIDSINRDIDNIIATSDKTVNAHDVVTRVSGVLKKYEESITAADDLATIRSTVDKFLQHPLLTEAPERIAGELDRARATLADRVAARNDAVQQGGQLRAFENQQLVGSEHSYPVPGMPRVPARISPQLDRATEAGGALADVSEIAKQRTAEIGEAAARVRQLQQELADASKGDFTIQQAQALKRSAYKNIGPQGYGPGLKPLAERDATKAIARGLKEEVAQAEPQVSILNEKESRLIGALDTIEARVLVEANKNPLGLGSLIAHPKLMAIWLMDRSPLFKSIVARMQFNLSKVLRNDGLIAPHAVASTGSALHGGALHASRPMEGDYIPAPRSLSSLALTE